MLLDPSVAHRCIQLETGVLFLFLVVALSAQLARSGDITHYRQNTLRQFYYALSLFILLSLIFSLSLYAVSILLAIELAAGITLAFLHPVNALCLFVHLLFLRPWELVVQEPNSFLLALPRLLAVVCFISWLMYPTQHARLTKRTFRALSLLLIFSGWLLLTIFKTPHVADTLSAWFDSYAKSLIVFVMCLFFIESDHSVAEFEQTIVVSTLALMTVGYYEFLSIGSHSGRLSSVGIFGDPNDLAAVIDIAIPLALIPAFSGKVNLVNRIGGFLFSGFSLLVIWFTKSRGALLALVTQLLTPRFINNPGRKWLGTFFLASALCFGYLGVLKAIPRASAEMEESRESRLSYWRAAVGMTLHHPVWGVGFNQYRENSEAYVTGIHYEQGKHTAHSSWLLAFAESGIPGGVLYIAFFLNVLRTAWRAREQRPAQLYALVGYAVSMSFLSHTYSLYVFILAGLVLASSSIQGGVNEL